MGRVAMCLTPCGGPQDSGEHSWCTAAVFWVAFSCIAVLIPVISMGWLKMLDILACGFIGSYLVVLAVDSYMHIGLSYITLHVFKRVPSISAVPQESGFKTGQLPNFAEDSTFFALSQL